MFHSSIIKRITTGVVATVAALSLAACGAVTNDSAPVSSAASSSGEFVLADRIKQKVDNGEKLVIKLSYHDPSLAFATPQQ